MGLFSNKPCIMILSAMTLISCASTPQQSESTSIELLAAKSSNAAIGSAEYQTTNSADENRSKFIVFSWKDRGFYHRGSSRHWDNPSTFTIESDGQWAFYAYRLANWQRCNFTNCGRKRIYVLVQYYGGPPAADNRCTGQLIRTAVYVDQGIGFGEQFHFTRKGTDTQFRDNWADYKCAWIVNDWH